MNATMGSSGAILRGAVAGVTLLAVCSCGERSTPEVRAAIATQLAHPKDDDRVIAAFYARREHRPFWTRANAGGGDAAGEAAEALLEQLRTADTRGLPRAPYRPEAIAAQLGLQMDPTLRAQTEVALSRVFLRYAGDVAHGRVEPAEADAWLIPRRAFDPARALALLEERGVEDAIAALEPQSATYRRLLEARTLLAAQVEDGGWTAVEYDGLIEPGERHEALPQIRARLIAGGELTRDARVDDPQLYDEKTVAAVKDFQRRHGIAVDGILGPEARDMLNTSARQRLDQVDWNLERLRWLPEAPAGRRVDVNLAAFRLYAYDGDELVLRMPVIVGKTQHATPAFVDEIEYLMINPYWNVPQSIAINEIVPKVAADPAYLVENDMEVLRQLGPNAEAVDPDAVDWARHAGGDDFPYRLRQRPGPDNALGRIKFMFPNEYAIYLHDTPAGHLFSEPQRSFSHGCIRVRDPIELADFLLAPTSEWNGERVRAAIDTAGPRRVELAERVPVRLYYLTAWADEDGERINFREDIYGRDDRLRARLHGVRPPQTARRLSMRQ